MFTIDLNTIISLSLFLSLSLSLSRSGSCDRSDRAVAKKAYHRRQPSRNRAENASFCLVSRNSVYLLEYPACLALFRKRPKLIRRKSRYFFRAMKTFVGPSCAKTHMACSDNGRPHSDQIVKQNMIVRGGA